MTQPLGNGVWEDPCINDTVAIVNGAMKITLPECWDTRFVAKRWQLFRELIEAEKPDRVMVDGAAVAQCDSAGAQLLLEIEASQEARHGQMVWENIPDALQSLCQIIRELPKPKPVDPMPHVHPFVRVGQWVEAFFAYATMWLTFFGQTLTGLARFCLHPTSLPWKDTWRIVDAVGPGSIGVIALMGALLGLITSFEGSIALSKFGAQVFVTNLVGISLVRELAPLMSAIMLIGRSGSAFAAELGSMTINQEVDALRTMAVDPIRYLVMPRVLASITMMPIMSLVMIVFGLLGCAVVIHTLGYTMAFYIHKLEQAVSNRDLLIGLVKTLFFGLVVGLIGCQRGLTTQSGSVAVGRAATGSVVLGVMSVVFLDGLFGVIFYTLGV